MKRLCAVLFTLILLAGMLSAFVIPVSAADKETIVIAGSDFQVGNNDTSKIEKILNNMEIHGITKVDCAFFCGDYTTESTESNQSQYGVYTLKETFSALTGGNMLFVQGNHDMDTTAGLSKAGNNDPAHKAYGVFIIHEDQYPQWGNDRTATEKVSQELRAYLEAKCSQGWKQPVFILNHIPLHWSNRTKLDGSGTDAALIFDVLNEYGEKGLNIIYLYGHNHSGGYDDFMGGAAVYLKKGDTIQICKKGDATTSCEERKKHYELRTLKFTYMNAGYIGAYAQGGDETDKTLTMSVFRIRGEEVIITRYNGNGINLNTGEVGIHNLKSKGVRSEYFYNKYKFHIEDINTLEYASSRKVTATDDVPVDTPLPIPTEETTTTSTALSANTTQSATVVPDTSTAASTTQIKETAKEDATASTAETAIEENNATEDAATTTENGTVVEGTATQNASAEDTAAAEPLFPWWVWLIIGGGAILLIGTIVVIVLMLRSAS